MGVSLLDACFSYVVFVSLYFLSCTWVGLFGVSLGYLGVTRGYAEPTWGFWRLFGIQYFGRITHCSLFPAFDSGLVGLVLGKGRYLLGGGHGTASWFPRAGASNEYGCICSMAQVPSMKHESLLSTYSPGTSRYSLLTANSQEPGRAMKVAASLVWEKCYLWSTSHFSLLTTY